MKFSAIAAVVILALSVSDGRAVTHLLSGPIDPLQATTNSENVGNGSGTISGDYDATTNTLNYTITWMDLTSDVTNMHFHLGAPGEPGGVEVGVPGPWASPQVGTGVIVEDAKETNLLAGNWYLNIHTQDFGGGEIRGQVLVTPIPEPTACGLAVLALAAGWSGSRRARR